MELSGKLILAFYIDRRGVDQVDLAEFVNDVKSRFSSLNDSSVAMFFIPIDGDSRIECVNPVLVTEQDAIDNFNIAVGTLNNLISKFTKEEKNEKKDKKQAEESGGVIKEAKKK